jgi:hypothetical protein
MISSATSQISAAALRSASLKPAAPTLSTLSRQQDSRRPANWRQRRQRAQFKSELAKSDPIANQIGNRCVNYGL